MITTDNRTREYFIAVIHEDNIFIKHKIYNQKINNKQISFLCKGVTRNGNGSISIIAQFKDKISLISSQKFKTITENLSDQQPSFITTIWKKYKPKHKNITTTKGKKQIDMPQKQQKKQKSPNTSDIDKKNTHSYD